jgi:hypothetical protein
LTAALGVFSCQAEKDADGSRYLAGPALEIVSKDVVFSPQGGTGSIVVNTRENLIAVADRSWAVLSISGNRVTITVDRNESLESRYSSITLSAGGATAEITAQQFGMNSAYAWDDTYTFPFGGGELDLPYGENGTVWVDVSDVDWITAVVDEENHLIHFTVAKNIYNSERVGHVTVTIGDDYTREITFIQRANPAGLNPGEEEPMEFTIEPAWKPYYVTPQSNDQDYSTVGVEVAEGSHAGRYFIKVLPASEFNSTDPDDLQIYLNRHAPEWAAASPQIHRASAEEVIEALPMGSYVVGAIGVDNDNKVNGSVAFTVFSVTKVLTPYEKFLGTWSFDRNGQEDIWTVTEKELNKSYNISGFDGNTTITAEAVFNADGTMTLHAQANLGENTVSTSSGNVTGQAGLFGRILYQGTEYYVTGSYPIFTATVSADASEAQLAPGSVNTNVGEFDLIGFALYTIVGNSAYALNDKDDLPATIKHLTQGSGSGGDEPGGDDPDPGSGDYAKWLGSWNVGGVTLTVSQKVKDKTYTVSGLEGEYTFETRFKDGKMEFFYQVIYEESPYEVCLYGIDDDGDGYIVEGDPENDGWLATATLNAAGTSASLVGAEFDAVYSGTTYHERIIHLLILAYNNDTGGFYYVSDDPQQIDMPTTMTKASSSSVCTLRSAGLDVERGIFIPAFSSFTHGAAVPFKNKID